MDDKLPREEHEKAAKDTWEKVKEAILNPYYSLVIADELNVALHLGLLQKKDVIEFLTQHKEENLDIMVTGRYACEEMLEIADLVSEIIEIKHPYNDGLKAERGREY